MAKNNLTKGLFISFEGPDGSGKTTIINKLYSYLNKSFKNKVFKTREPGGTNNCIAEDIRNILLNNLNYKIDPKTEALLFAASRAQHMHDFILPHLQKKHIVLCDRFVDSSIVYQGIGRNLGIDNVRKINDFAIDNHYPNLTFVFMLDPKEGLKRINTNATRERNRLDKEKFLLHKKVFEGYKKLLAKKDKRFVVIDASKTVDNVFNQVKRKIHEFVGLK